MSSLSLGLLSCVVGVISSEQCPTTARDGHPYTFTLWLDLDSPGAHLEHESEHFANVVVGQCVTSTMTCVSKPGYSSTITLVPGNGYEMEVTINTVTRSRDTTNWIWKDESNIELRRCDLDVFYGPTLKRFLANTESQQLEVNDGETVTFLCEAEGHPRPGVQIRSQRSNLDLNLLRSFAKDTITGRVGKVMRCEDTDTYICSINNGVGDVLKGHLSVFVRCALEFSASFDKASKSFKYTSKYDLEVKVNVMGHPKPMKYKLTKGIISDGNVQNTVTKGVVIEDVYDVVYIEGEPPEGTVVLKMFDLQDDASGEYELTIINGIGDGLKYGFMIADTGNDDDDNVWAGWSVPEKIAFVIGLMIAFLMIAPITIKLVIHCYCSK